MAHLLLRMSLILAAVWGSAAAANWPQFRGPGGQGVSNETNLPTIWSADNNIVWRTRLPGPGSSSPIVVGKRIFVTCYSGYGVKPGAEGEGMDKLMRHAVCVDRATGATVWTRDFKAILPESMFGQMGTQDHGFSSSTPVSDGERLYLFFGRSGVFCLDLDGREIWHAVVGDGIHNFGTGASPVIYQNLLIVNASIEGNCLIALDKNTGKQVWRAGGLSNGSYCTPVLMDAAAGTELVITDVDAILGFEPATGKELWRVRDMDGDTVRSAVAHKGVIYCDRNGVFAIRAGGRGDVTNSHVLWQTKGRDSLASPLFDDGRLFVMARGTLICLDAATGGEIYRHRLTDNSKGFYASPVLGDGKIYYLDRAGTTFVVAAGPTFKELARNPLGDDAGRANASPIISDGCLLIRTDQFLYCIGNKGKVHEAR